MAVTTVNAEAEGRTAAEKFRKEHRLGSQPLGDLVALIEQSAGVDVAVLNAGPDEHGLTMRDPHRDTVFIGVARTRHPMRQRSTLAHELAHVLFGDWVDNTACDWSAPSPTESRANAFARHLLLPVDGLKAFLDDVHEINLATLSSVVQRFLVSPQIAAITFELAGYVDADTKREWMSVTASCSPGSGCRRCWDGCGPGGGPSMPAGATSTARFKPTPISGGRRSDCLPVLSEAMPRVWFPRRRSPPCRASLPARLRRSCAKPASTPRNSP